MNNGQNKALMYHSLAFLILILWTNFSTAQITDIADLQPKEDFENVHLQKIYSDSLTSTFVIWIKKEVKLHKHEKHTEQVYILAGEGMMKIGDQEKVVKAGDIIFIPAGTPHAVKVTSQVPMKVISIQAPEFTGEDRIWLE